MEALLAYLLPLLQIFLYVAVGFGIFALVGVARQYIQHKNDRAFTVDWNNVLAYVSTAVLAVKQIYSQKPQDMSEEDWNDKRFEKANQLVIAFAKELGFTITDEFLDTVRGAIEAEVNRLKGQTQTFNLGRLNSIEF